MKSTCKYISSHLLLGVGIFSMMVDTKYVQLEFLRNNWNIKGKVDKISILNETKFDIFFIL